MRQNTQTKDTSTSKHVHYKCICLHMFAPPHRVGARCYHTAVLAWSGIDNSFHLDRAINVNSNRWKFLCARPKTPCVPAATSPANGSRPPRVGPLSDLRPRHFLLPYYCLHIFQQCGFPAPTSSSSLTAKTSLPPAVHASVASTPPVPHAGSEKSAAGPRQAPATSLEGAGQDRSTVEPSANKRRPLRLLRAMWSERSQSCSSSILPVFPPDSAAREDGDFGVLS